MSASGIIVNPSVPAKNLKEFIAYAKANQDKISYGSAGAGTMTHLAGELFKHLTGTPKIVHVPYKGAGPSINDLVGGAVQYATINVTGQLLQLHNSGKVRILAVTSAGAPQGRAEFPDRRRGGTAEHGGDAVHRTAGAGRHAEADRRPDLRGRRRS